MAEGDEVKKYKCNRRAFAKKLRETREKKPSADLVPLWKHLQRLAINDVKSGAGDRCRRAGRMLRQARELARKYPK